MSALVTKSEKLTQKVYEKLKTLINSGNLTAFTNALNETATTDIKTALATSFDKNGCTLIHWAGGSSSSTILQYLLQTHTTISPNILAVKQSLDRTPLHYAARNGSVECARILIEEFGGEVDWRCKGGVTPFQVRARRSEERGGERRQAAVVK